MIAASPRLRSLRVAIVHDYLNQRGGAEKVVEVFSRMFPDAPVFTSVYDPDAMGEYWRSVDVRTSFMQSFGRRLGIAKALLPLYPTAFEQFDLSEFDLVLSSSSSFAKGVITRPDTVHVCYCYSPTRFLWMYHDYTGHQTLPPGVRAALPAMMTPLRMWDYAAAQRVDHFIGISNTVAHRIDKYYRRPSSVVEPPVDVGGYRLSSRHDEYYLVLARLHSYKRVDIAVEACSRLGLPLKIAGDGPDRGRLERLAGDSVEFLGRVSDGEAQALLSTCRALLWPGEEDFGLVPVEAQASGRPVIAFQAGGAAETVIDGETGVLFAPQTAESLTRALENFQPDAYAPAVLRKNAMRYDIGSFVHRMNDELERCVAQHSAATWGPGLNGARASG